MRSPNTLLLFASLITILAVSDFAFAADNDEENAVIDVDNDAEAQSGEEPSANRDEEDDEEEASVTMSYSAEVSSPKRQNSRCYREVAVKGPGIDDVIRVSCAVDNSVIADQNILVVGTTLFSNTPNTIVVVKGGKCEQRTYAQPANDNPADGTTSPATTKLGSQECATIRRTMVEARRKAGLQENTEAGVSGGSNVKPGLLGGNNFGTGFPGGTNLGPGLPGGNKLGHGFPGVTGGNKLSTGIPGGNSLGSGFPGGNNFGPGIPGGNRFGGGLPGGNTLGEGGVFSSVGNLPNIPGPDANPAASLMNFGL